MDQPADLGTGRRNGDLGGRCDHSPRIGNGMAHVKSVTQRKATLGLSSNQQQCVENIVESVRLQHAEQAAEETLALPIYPELNRKMQEYVVKSIAQFYR